MKQLVILSGKGGTGKTSVAAAFAHLASLEKGADKIVLADADVDAANLELVLTPTVLSNEDFFGGQVAIIDQETCIDCGVCVPVCRFDAISNDTGAYIVDPIACDGCVACVYQCPVQAITMQEQRAGVWMHSQTRFGPLFHANLLPAQENSGKLVTLVKQHARLLAMDEGRELVLVDGPPGIGCSVISATSGADMALIVAEPTVAGVHDMERVLQTTNHFGVSALVCINKADLYPAGADEIEQFCQEQGIPLAGRIPFDPTMSQAIVQGEPITLYRPQSAASQALQAVWRTVMTHLEQKT